MESKEQRSEDRDAVVQQRRTVKLSKLLSAVLRHQALEMGFEIRSDGCIAIHRLLAHQRFRGYTLEEIRTVVRDSDKQRFTIVSDEGVEYIRANQGHSLACVSTEEIMSKITDPSTVPVCVHGTYRKFLRPILSTGLNRMQRNHIHMATGMPSSGVISGMRKSCEIVIHVDIALAMADGIEFFLSANGVVLTSGVDGVLAAKYFKKVEDRIAGREIPIDSTEEVKEPEVPEVEQRFDKLIVLDFEATCLDGEQISPQEVIELPSVVIDVKRREIIGEWRTYVRPVYRPVLSAFCTELTGIQQEQVDNAPTFEEAFGQYMQWLTENDLLNDRTAFVTCGDWDLKTMMPAQAELSGIRVPAQMRQWINVKTLMSKFKNAKIKSFLQMLDMLGLRVEGRHHSGLDDSRNIARACIELLKQGCVFNLTKRAPASTPQGKAQRYVKLPSASAATSQTSTKR